MPKRDHWWFLHSSCHVDADQSWQERVNVPPMCLPPQISLFRRCDTHRKMVQNHTPFACQYIQILMESNRGEIQLTYSIPPWSLVPDNLLSRAAYSKSGWRAPILFNSEGLYHKEGSRGTDLGQVKVKFGQYRPQNWKQNNQWGEDKHLRLKTTAFEKTCISASVYYYRLRWERETWFRRSWKAYRVQIHWSVIYNMRDFTCSPSFLSGNQFICSHLFADEATSRREPFLWGLSRYPISQLNYCPQRHSWYISMLYWEDVQVACRRTFPLHLNMFSNMKRKLLNVWRQGRDLHSLFHFCEEGTWQIGQWNYDVKHTFLYGLTTKTLDKLSRLFSVEENLKVLFEELSWTTFTSHCNRTEDKCRSQVSEDKTVKCGEAWPDRNNEKPEKNT